MTPCSGCNGSSGGEIQYVNLGATGIVSLPPEKIAPQGAGSGLDADLLDGLDSSAFAIDADVTASSILGKMLTVDGAGSGLNADLLDGRNVDEFVQATLLATSIYQMSIPWITVPANGATLNLGSAAAGDVGPAYIVILQAGGSYNGGIFFMPGNSGDVVAIHSSGFTTDGTGTYSVFRQIATNQYRLRNGAASETTWGVLMLRRLPQQTT